MKKLLMLSGCMLLAITACTSGSAKEVADGFAPGSRPNAVPRVLSSGTRIDVTMRRELSSRTDSIGETVESVVTHNVTDLNGAIAIPAGATLFLSIVALEPARDQGNRTGRVSLAATSVTVEGAPYAVAADVGVVQFTLVGRGITKAEAARIGAGTAIGAVVGQAIGKNTKSTVIGGAVGAVAGTAVAVRYAERDAVVAAGTPVVLTLTQPLSVWAK